jgi:hypothetical protein
MMLVLLHVMQVLTEARTFKNCLTGLEVYFSGRLSVQGTYPRSRHPSWCVLLILTYPWTPSLLRACQQRIEECIRDLKQMLIDLWEEYTEDENDTEPTWLLSIDNDSARKRAQLDQLGDSARQ